MTPSPGQIASATTHVMPTGPFARLGRWSAKHRRWVIGVWIVLFLVMAPLAGKLGGRLSQGGFEISGSTSNAANGVIAKKFTNQFPANMTVVVSSKTLAPSDPAFVAVIDQTVTMIPMHTGGSVTAIATSSSGRVSQIPDVPTFAQAGVPAFDLTVWNAIAAPAATPQAVLERLESSLKTALADPVLRHRFADLAADMPRPDQLGAEPLRRLIASDIERFGPIIKAVGVKVE